MVRVRAGQTLDMLLGYRNLFFFNLHRIACSSENSVPLCGLTVKTEEIVPSIFILFSIQISLIQPETGIRNDMYARRTRQRRPTCTVNIQNITHILLSDMLRTALQRSFILGRKQADGSKQLVSCYPADELLGFFPAGCLAVRCFQDFGISFQNFSCLPSGGQRGFRILSFYERKSNLFL